MYFAVLCQLKEKEAVFLGVILICWEKLWSVEESGISAQVADGR